MPSAPYRWLAAAIAALLLGGVAVVTLDGDDEEDIATKKNERTEQAEDKKKRKKAAARQDGGEQGDGGATASGSPDEPVSNDDGGTAAGEPGATGDGGSGGGSGASGGSGGGEEPAPAVGPAAAGRYTYDVEGEVTRTGALAGSEPAPPTAKLTVKAPDGERQRSILDSRDSEGQGGVSTTDLVYDGNRVLLAYLKLSSRFGGITQTYEFRPEPHRLVATADAEQGDDFDFDMTSTDGGITVHTEIDVLDTERLTIGGQAVDTVVFKRVSTFEGDFEGTITTRAHVSPEHSLEVKNHTVSDIDAGIMQIHSDTTSVLRSLRPA